MVTYEDTLTDYDRATILLSASKNEAEDEFLLTPAKKVKLPAGELMVKLRPMNSLKERIQALGYHVQENSAGWTVFK